MARTVDSTIDTSGPFACDGANKTFSGGFGILDSSHALVTIINSLEERTSLIEDTDYTINIVSDSSFQVITTSAYDAGNSIYISRNVPLTQEISYSRGGKYSGANNAYSHNKQTMALQMLQEQVDRCVKHDLADEPTMDEATYLNWCEYWALRAEAAGSAAGDPILQQSFVATAAQDTFNTFYTLPANEAALEVYIDGVKQEKNTISVTGEKQFVVGDTLTGGEIVEYITRTTGLEMVVSTVNAWTGQQYAVNQSLTSGTTIDWNLDVEQSASITLAHNATVNTPTNMKPGATYTLFIYQTGSYTLDFGSSFYWREGTKPVATTGAGAIDIISFISDGTYMYGVRQDNFQVGA